MYETKTVWLKNVKQSSPKQPHVCTFVLKIFAKFLRFLGFQIYIFLKIVVKYKKNMLSILESTLNGWSTTRPTAITSHIWLSDVVLVIDSVRCIFAVVPCRQSPMCGPVAYCVLHWHRSIRTVAGALLSRLAERFAVF